MPIFDQGYQHWQGQLSGHSWRSFSIARQGVRAHFKNRWTRMVILLAWGPALALAGGLIFWGLIEQKSSLVAPILQMMSDLPEIQINPQNYRSAVWTISYQVFFKFEIFFSMILVLLVGPALISQDLRFNSLPLYFSRPLRRVDYFVGKLGVIAFFLGAVAIVPALLAYLLGVGFSLDFKVLPDTFSILAASLAFGCIVVASAGTLMLAISSLTRNSRYVGAIWFGFWVITYVLAGILPGVVRQDWCPLVSYTENLDRLHRALLDTSSAWHAVLNLLGTNPRTREQILLQWNGPEYPWYWSAAVLAGLFGLSLWTLTFRVKTLDRLK
jgi:ABC-2 type transport system permease protein